MIVASVVVAAADDVFLEGFWAFAFVGALLAILLFLVWEDHATWPPGDREAAIVGVVGGSLAFAAIVLFHSWELALFAQPLVAITLFHAYLLAKAALRKRRKDAK